jgi:hypothetical protein
VLLQIVVETARLDFFAPALDLSQAFSFRRFG